MAAAWCLRVILKSVMKANLILTGCEAVCEGIGLSLIIDGVDGHGVLRQRGEVA